jgi:hypothetical protein
LGKAGAGGIPIRTAGIKIKVIAPTRMTEVRHPKLDASGGKVNAARMPPRGIPVCLTPMAVALPWEGNQFITALVVAGFMELYPVPARNRRKHPIGKELAAPKPTMKIPRIPRPRIKANRTPKRSVIQPMGMETEMTPT